MRPSATEELLLRVKVAMPLAKVYAGLFGPDSRDGFWLAHLRRLGYSTVTVGDWVGEAGGEAPVSRPIRYTVPVKGLAVKQADTEGRQVRCVVGAAGCVVDCETRTPKVPYGTSFRMLVRYRLLPEEGEGSAVLEISAEVLFVKEVMRVIRNKIKTAGYAQVREAGKALAKDLQGGGGDREGGAEAGTSDRTETWLLKQSNKIKSWNPRWCLASFESGVFEWRKNPKDYTPNGFLHLRKGGVRVAVQNIRGDPKYDGRCFTVTDAKRSMYFTAETPALCQQWVQALRRVTGEEAPPGESTGLLQAPREGEAARGAEAEGNSASVVRLMVGQSKNLVSADSTMLGSRRIRFTVQFGDVTRTTRMERCGQDAVWDETFSFSTKGSSARQIQIVAEEIISGGSMHSLGSLYVDLDQFSFDEPTSFWSILRTNPDAGVKSAIAGKIKLTLQIISMGEGEPKPGGGAGNGPGSKKPAGGGLPFLLSCCLGGGRQYEALTV